MHRFPLACMVAIGLTIASQAWGQPKRLFWQFCSLPKGASEATVSSPKDAGFGSPVPFKAKDRVADELQTPWGARENSSMQFGWKAEPDGQIYFERTEGGKDFFAPPITDSGCLQKSAGKLSLVECPLVKLLYAEKQLLFVAVEEYGPPAIELLHRIEYKGEARHLIRTWEKGVEQYFDLFLESGKWKANLCKTIETPVE